VLRAALTIPLLAACAASPCLASAGGAIAVGGAGDVAGLLAVARLFVIAEAAKAEPAPAGEPAAGLTAPARVLAGERFELDWSGPDGPEDYLSLAAAGSADDDYLEWAPTGDGRPAELRAPGEPGAYELRYVDGAAGGVLARLPLEVVAVDAELTAPASARAGLRFEVSWSGPDGPGDHIAVSRVEAPDHRSYDWAATAIGSPLTLVAPPNPGPYQVRYVSGSTGEILARAAIEILP
jgi:Ca-activated chloride channel family protein